MPGDLTAAKAFVELSLKSLVSMQLKKERQSLLQFRADARKGTVEEAAFSLQAGKKLSSDQSKVLQEALDKTTKAKQNAALRDVTETLRQGKKLSAGQTAVFDTVLTAYRKSLADQKKKRDDSFKDEQDHWAKTRKLAEEATAKRAALMASMGRGAGFGLMAGVGAGVGAVASASPDMMNTLGNSIKWLAATIGITLLPEIIRVTKFIQGLAMALRDMSPQTKDAIGVSARMSAYALAAAKAGSVAGPLGVGAVAVGAAAYEAGGAVNRQEAIKKRINAYKGNIAEEDILANPNAKAAYESKDVGVTRKKLAENEAQLKGINPLFPSNDKQIESTLQERAMLRKVESSQTGGGAVSSRSDMKFAENVVGFIKKKLGFATDEPAKTDDGLKVSSFGSPQIMGITDAWKQAQLSVVQGNSPEAELLKIQMEARDILLESSGKLGEIERKTGPATK